jgi:hypothetical protein
MVLGVAKTAAWIIPLEIRPGTISATPRKLEIRCNSIRILPRACDHFRTAKRFGKRSTPNPEIRLRTLPDQPITQTFLRKQLKLQSMLTTTD